MKNCISIYSIPQMENMVCFGTETYVNLFGILATFGIHIPKVRNMLQMNQFAESFFREIDTTFEIYHVCRDIRRSIFKWECDKELTESMIHLNDALRLIQIFERFGKEKNSYWYGNANNFLQSFPDTPVCNISERYQDIMGPLAYIEEMKDA